MPARKFAAAVVEAMAAASNWRLKVIPPDVSATTDPGPPAPFCAPCAATASAGITGTGAGKMTGGGQTEWLPPPWPTSGSNDKGTELASFPPVLRSLRRSSGSEVNRNFIHLVLDNKQ